MTAPLRPGADLIYTNPDDVGPVLDKLAKWLGGKDAAKFAPADIDAHIAYKTNGRVPNRDALAAALDAKKNGHLQVWLQANAPEDTNRRAEQADVPVTFHDLAHSAARGMTANFSDRLTAGLTALTQGVPYADALEAVRQQHERFAQAHPVLDFTASVAPVVGLGATRAAMNPAAPSAAETSLGAKVLKSTAVGGGYAGLAAGADSRAPTFKGQVADALEAVPSGAVLAPAVTLASGPVGALFKGLKNAAVDIANPAKGGDIRAIGKIAADMSEGRLQGVPGARTAFEAADARAPGVPVVADASPMMRSSLRSAVNASPVAREAAQEALGARNADEATRLSRSLEERAGFPGGVHTKAEADLAAQLLRQEADPRYLKLAMDNPQVASKGIVEVLNNPAVKAAWEDAQKLAEADGLPPLTTLFDNAGNVRNIPDFRSLNYIRKALNDQADAGFNGSRGTGKAWAAARRDLADKLTAEMEQNVPEFQQTQQWYRVKKQELGGYEAGRKAWAGTMDPRDINTELAKLPPGARETFRAGMVDAASKDLREVATNVDASRRLFNAGENGKLRQRYLFPTSDDYESFAKDLKDAKLRRETLNAVNNQSATNQNAQDEMQRALPREAAGAVRHGVRGLLSGFLGGARKPLFGPAERAAAKREAEILLSSGSEARKWLETLEKAQRSAERAARIEQSVTTGGLPAAVGRSASDSTSAPRAFGDLLWKVPVQLGSSFF